MSRRSILLATTFFVAIGSIAVVGPASAHGFGFGGFGGGQSGPAFAARSPGASGVSNIGRTPVQPMNNFVGGAKLDHVPSIATPAAQGNISGPRIEPNRIPAVTNATIPNSPPPPVRQLPQAPTSSGIVARQPDAAGIVNTPAANRLSAAGIVTSSVTARIPGNPVKGIEPDVSARLKEISTGEGGAKLQKPGSNPEVPNVAGNPTVPGHGPEHDPSSSGAPGNGPTVNLPGTMGQKGPREVPGYGNATNGPQVNLPGSVDRHGPDDASKALGKMEASDQALLDSATKGGPNSENIPTSPGAGVAVSDNTNGGKSGSSGSGSKPSGGTSGGGTGGGGKTGGSSNPLSVGPGVYGSGGTSPTKDGGSVTVSTMQDKGTTYQVVTVKDDKGNILSMTYSEKGKDGKVKTTSTGPEIPAKDKSTPSDDGSGTIGSLNPNSGAGKTGNGGGTDNNGTEASGGKSTQLANGTSLGSTAHGDGTGTHGDNSSAGIGALAGGTSMARKDYGDGGGSDNRDGGTSLGAPKIGPAGGGSHAAATAGAAANAH